MSASPRLAIPTDVLKSGSPLRSPLRPGVSRPPTRSNGGTPRASEGTRDAAAQGSTAKAAPKTHAAHDHRRHHITMDVAERLNEEEKNKYIRGGFSA